MVKVTGDEESGGVVKVARTYGRLRCWRIERMPSNLGLLNTLAY